MPLPIVISNWEVAQEVPMVVAVQVAGVTAAQVLQATLVLQSALLVQLVVGLFEQYILVQILPVLQVVAEVQVVLVLFEQ